MNESRAIDAVRKQVAALPNVSASIPSALSQYMAGLKAHDVATIGGALTEEIWFVTPVKTMAKPAILEFLAALYRGFPDWYYDHEPPELRDDGSWAVLWRQGGTHTGELAFSGFEVVPATGRSVTIPPHHFFYQVGPDGLTEIRPDPIPGGAPRGIFEQIGVELPPL